MDLQLGNFLYPFNVSNSYLIANLIIISRKLFSGNNNFLISLSFEKIQFKSVTSKSINK